MKKDFRDGDSIPCANSIGRESCIISDNTSSNLSNSTSGKLSSIKL